jgi:hypothetical protein
MQKDQAEIVRSQKEMVSAVQDEMAYLSNEVAELQVDKDRRPQRDPEPSYGSQEQQRYGSQFRHEEDTLGAPVFPQSRGGMGQNISPPPYRNGFSSRGGDRQQQQRDPYYQNRGGYQQNRGGFQSRGGYQNRGGFQQFSGRNQQYRDDFQQHNERGYGSTRANGFCYSCGKFGHFMRDCWSREPQRPSAQNPFFQKN